MSRLVLAAWLLLAGCSSPSAPPPTTNPPLTAATSLSPGQTLNGSLTPGATITLTNLRPRTGIELSVEGADFRPSLEIFDTATNETVAAAIGLTNTLRLRTFVRSNITYGVRVTPPGSTNQGRYRLSLTTLPEGVSGFQIDLRFLETSTGPVSPAIQRVSQQAAARWQTLITADLPDAFVSLAPGQCNLPLTAAPIINQPVDDLLVLVSVDASINASATAGPCRTRGLGTPTVVGQVNLNPSLFVFDEATIRDVIIHEIGHVLGLGLGSPTWSRGIINPGTADPRQTTANAVRQYQALGGQQATIPVQLLVQGHWRGDNEGGDSLGMELMTPTVQVGVLNPLSRITLGFLEDMDYTVNLGAADPFTVPTGNRHGLYREGRFIDLSNDLIPLPDDATAGVELR